MPSLPLPPFVQPPATIATKKPAEIPVRCLIDASVSNDFDVILLSLFQKEIEKRPEVKKKEPPGCPPGPPPNLTDMREFDSDYESDEEEPKSKRAKTVRDDVPSRKDEDKEDDLSVKQPTSLQQRMLAISGQNIDEFMKEMENVQKKKEQERAADLQERLSTLGKDKESSDNSDSKCEPFR